MNNPPNHPQHSSNHVRVGRQRVGHQRGPRRGGGDERRGQDTRVGLYAFHRQGHGLGNQGGRAGTHHVGGSLEQLRLGLGHLPPVRPFRPTTSRTAYATQSSLGSQKSWISIAIGRTVAGKTARGWGHRKQQVAAGRPAPAAAEAWKTHRQLECASRPQCRCHGQRLPPHAFQSSGWTQYPPLRAPKQRAGATTPQPRGSFSTAHTGGRATLAMKVEALVRKIVPSPRHEVVEDSGHVTV